MRKLFTIILLAILCVNAMAYDFSAVCSTGQTLYYNITSNVDPYTVEVTSETGSGYNTQPTGDLEIPETVEYNSVTYSVTSIGNYALYKSSGLSSLIIPNSVTSIGDYAIRDCSGLTSITIPNSVTSIGTSAFYHVRNVMYDGTATGSPWSALTVNGYVEDGLVYTDNTKEHLTGCSTLATSVNISSSVISIGDYTFDGCTGLTSVTIPNSVITIGHSAFAGCSGLTEITIGNSVTSIGNYAFYNCSGLTSIDMPNSVTSVGESAITGTGWLNNQPDGIIYLGKSCIGYKGSQPTGNLALDDEIKGIASSAFKDCTGITSVTAPSSIVSIGELAFARCTGLTEITIPDSATSIGSRVFMGCSELTTVNFNAKNCTTMPSDVWQNCSALATLNIGEKVKNIPDYAFYSCTGLTEITIPDSVTSIGDRAFYGCSGLTTVNFNAQNCTTMGGTNPVFEDCPLLATLNIGEKVKNIPDYAFYSCTGLTEITIPDSVTSIGDRAFYGCSGLTTVNFNAQNCTTMGGTNPVFEDCPLLATLNIGENVKSISENAFYGCTGLSEITIPDSITSIGEMAFYGCTGLTTVNFNAKNCTTMGSSSNPVFYNCTSFSTLNIGENVENIPGYAFRGCSGLETITIGNSLESIGDYAFDNCSSLTAVYISDISQWCAISFAGLSTNANPLGLAHNLYINNELVTDLVLPNTITEIKPYVFKNATCLTSVTIPSSVTSIGYQAFYGCSNLTTVNFNAENCTTMGSSSSPVFYNCTSFSTLNIGERVKSIPDYAFSDCTGLTEITIPDSVTNIGSYAFIGCSGLTEITIPDLVVNIGSQAFNRCSSLSVVNFNAENCTTMGTLFSPVFFNNTSITTLNIGERVKSIPDYAFSDCSALTEITIPDSVTSIGQKAFYACSGLTTLNFNAKNCTVMGSSSSHVFDNCTSLSTLNIGENVKILPDCAFYNCSALTDVTIPDSVVSIGERAFYGCSTLATVNFNAENCTTMGSSSYKVFEEGAILTTLNIGEKVKNIPDYAFYGCSNMTGTLVIPDSVINIGTYAFGRCSSLDTLTIDKSVESIGERAFDECSELTAVNFNAENCTTMGSSSNPVFYNCTSLTTINIGEDVKNIPNYAFYNCSGLTGTLTIPDSVTNIGTYAFGNCSSIDTVTIGNSVENIGENGFYNCSALAFVTIGESVETIGGYAFHYCDNIAEINALVNTPPELGNQVFRTTPYSSAIVKVPCSTLDAYSSASGWSDFSNIQERFDYTLAVSSDNEQQGTVSITQQPNCSDNNGIITATPATGYRFLSWNDGNTDNPRTVIVTSDSTFTAGFKAIYIITATAGEGGTITPSGEVSVDEGESQTFTITPNTGYRIASVMVDGTENVTDQLVDGVYTFENVTASHSIEATFEAIPSFTITVSVNNDAYGSVSGGGTYEEGATATLTAIPNQGYRFVSWNDDNTENPRTITVTSDSTFVANFEAEQAQQYTITVLSNNDAYGSVYGGGTYDEGATATLTAIPNQGYRFVSWNDDNTENPRTITVTSDSTFVAAFVRDEGVEKENILVELFAYRGCGYSPYAAKALDNMEDTDSLNIIVLDHHISDAYQYTESTNRFYYWAEKSNIFGEIYGFDGTPSTVFDGYVGMAGADTRESAMQDAYTTYYNNVKAIKSIYSFTAEFEQTEPESRTFTLNVTAEKLSEYYGDDQIVVMAALTEDIDYDWSVAGKINNLVRVLYPDANGTEATFDENNRFSTNITIDVSDEYDMSKSKVVVWIENHTQGRVMQSKRFLLSDYNETENTYTITVLANNDNYGYVTGSGTYEEGTEITLTAMPYQGYRFVSWNDNITDNPRTITVTSDSTFVAMFEAEQVQQYTITVLSNNDAYGSVSGSGTYYDGDTVVILAMPNSGYNFVSWDDGYEFNPRAVVVTSDSTFIADFAKCEITYAIDTVVNNFVTVGDHTFYSTGNYTFAVSHETACDTIFDIRLRVLAEPVYDIGPNPTKSLLNINSDGFISVVEFYSVTGQLIMRREVNGYEAEFDMEGLVDGVYILRIYGEESSLPAVSKIIKE